MKRCVFFISDRTGISAEMLGRSLLTQFEHKLEFEEKTLPFIDSIEKADEARLIINDAAKTSGVKPLVFDTIIMPEVRAVVHQSSGLMMDFFQTFIGPLEKELKIKSSFSVGMSHAIDKSGQYDQRIEAVNFALNSDDGASMKYFDRAEVILIGVSRCGKTPTSLYMAMQFGISAANYPFTADDMDDLKLPPELKKNKDKLFGLSIDPFRLHEIRTQRRANSKYATLKQCQLEVMLVEKMYRKEKIPYLNASSKSIEEIAVVILEKCNLKRRTF
jgi:hypothetical protein